MKKLVSLLVVLAMLLTMAPAVFAEESNSAMNPAQLLVGETNTLTLEEGGYYWYTWTATEAGTLTITFEPVADEIPWCKIFVNTVTFVDPVANINAAGGSATVTVAAGDEVMLSVEEMDCLAATFKINATFTASAALEGSGTDSDPWVLTSLEAVNGTFATTEDDHYYMYEVNESGTYTMDSFGGCNIMVFIDEIVWGEQVADPGAGFYVAAGQVIYLNMFYSYGDVGAYSAAFSFVAGEASEGGETEAPVGSVDNPDTDVIGYHEVTTDGNGYVYQWTAEEAILFVLEIQGSTNDGSNWSYFIMVERADGSVYEVSHDGTEDLLVPVAVIEVVEDDVITMMIATAGRDEDTIYFNAYTCMGSLEEPLEPYFIWNSDYSVASVNMAVLSSGMYVRGRSGMDMTINDENYGRQSYSTDPSLVEGNGEEFEVWSVVCTYPLGSSYNRHVVDSDGGEYTAIVKANQNYCFVYKATTSGTLTITVGGDVWYYKVSGTNQSTAAFSSTAENPTNSYSVAVHDGYTINVDVKRSSSWSDKHDADIPVTFTFVADGEPAVQPEELVLGTNELVAGGNGEYEKKVYSYTAETAGTVYFTVRAYYMDGGNDVEYAMMSYPRTNYTKMRINGQELTGDPEVEVYLNAGESVEVQLLSLNGDAYYVTLEISEEGFYEFQNGDREQPIVLNNADLPTTITIDAASEPWYQLGGDFSTGGELVFTGEGFVLYTVEYDSANEEFVYTPYVPENGEVRLTVTGKMCSGEVLLQIVNEGDAAVDVAVKTDYPVGHQMNPDELPINETFDVVLEEGNSGHWYTWTATEAGKLTITVVGDYWGYEINGSYYSADDNGENTVTLILEEGAEVSYFVETYYYDWDNWESVHPAGTLTVTTEFVAGAVTCDHTSTYYDLLWAEDYSTYQLLEYCNICSQLVATYNSVDAYIETGWNEDGTEATFTVEVPAEGGYFCAWYIGGMALSVTDENGNVVATPEIINNGYNYPCAFVVPNETGAAVTYTLTLYYPVGNQANPAQLVIGDNEFSVEANNYYGYYFTWTATGDGDLVLYVEAPEGVVYDFSVYNESSYKQLNLSEDAVDGVITMPVSEGDVIQITIVALEDADGNIYPACDFNLVAAFETNAPAVVLGDLNGDGTVDSADLNLLYRFVMEDETLTLTEAQILAGDLNQDGSTDSADLNILYRFVMEDDTLTWSPNA